MQQDQVSLQELEIKAVKDVKENYLEVSLSEQEKVIRHQVEIIRQHSPSGIMTFEERKSNQQTKLYYRLNSQLPLSYYLEREELGSAEIRQILEEIVEILLKSKNYLLSASGFLLQEDYIFLHAQTHKVSLFYLPLKLQGDALANFRQLLMNLNKSCEDLPQELLIAANEQFFNLSSFREQLREIKQPLAKEKKPVLEKTKTFQLESKLNSSGTSIPSQPAPEPALIPEVIASIKLKKKPLLVFLLIQVVLAVIIVLFSSSLKDLGGSLATYGGIFLIIMSFDLLLLKRLLKKDTTA